MSVVRNQTLWSHLPLRPCSSATTQSQGELLATRTSGAASQVVGQLPPIIINQSVLHNPSIPGECTRSFKFQFNSTQSNPTQFIIIMIRNRTNPTTRKPVFLCLPISAKTHRGDGGEEGRRRHHCPMEVPPPWRRHWPSPKAKQGKLKRKERVQAGGAGGDGGGGLR